MPARNSRKQYIEGGIYHIYNRGVEKRTIFVTEKDSKVFLHFLKQYLLPENHPDKDILNFKNRISVRRSFAEKIELIAYCLMPNHFHLLLKQKGENDLREFMQCLTTSYSIYFNKKHDRVGSLFQGRYKAVLIKEDNYLLHLSRYIHTNPYKGQAFAILTEYDFSSYQEYLGLRDTEWVKPNSVLEYFNESKNEGIINKNSYQNFVEEYQFDSTELLGDLILE